MIDNIQHGGIRPPHLVVDEVVSIDVVLQRFNREVDILKRQVQKERPGRIVLLNNLNCLLCIRRVNTVKGLVAKETVVLCRWGVKHENPVLSTELIM